MDPAERSARLERLFALQCEFLESALRDAEEILSLLESGGGADAEAHALRLRKLAHDLRGTGAVYGFATLAETAARLENAFAAAEPAEALRSCVHDLVGAVTEAQSGLKVLPHGLG